MNGLNCAAETVSDASLQGTAGSPGKFAVTNDTALENTYFSGEVPDKYQTLKIICCSVKSAITRFLISSRL
jgi:hypothetical protein